MICRRLKLALPALMLLLAGCGGSSNKSTAPTQTLIGPLSGKWNATFTATGASSPQYTLGVSILQSGTSLIGTPIPFTGGTIHGDSCFNSSNFMVQGNTSGSNFSMIFTDLSTAHLNVTGSFTGTSPSSASGNYSTQYPPPSSGGGQVCTDVQGTVSMARQ